MDMYRSTNIEFKKARFANNKVFHLIHIQDSFNITFIDCNISENFTRYSKHYSGALFRVMSSLNVSLKNSHIFGNETDYFFNGQDTRKWIDNKFESELALEDVTFENNTFKKGKYLK